MYNPSELLSNRLREYATVEAVIGARAVSPTAKSLRIEALELYHASRINRGYCPDDDCTADWKACARDYAVTLIGAANLIA